MREEKEEVWSGRRETVRRRGKKKENCLRTPSYFLGKRQTIREHTMPFWGKLWVVYVYHFSALLFNRAMTWTNTHTHITK